MSVPRLLVLLLLAHLLPAISQDTFVVDVTVQTTPVPQATFVWETQATGGTVQILRRAMGKEGLTGGNDFTLIATVSHPTATYTDTSVAAGNAYEYRILRPQFTVGPTTYRLTATYLAVTVEAPLVDDRGGVLLVVDQTLSAPMAHELALLEEDLVGDGWRVVRLDNPQHGVGTHQSLKAAIVAACAADPGIKALYLFGRLPYARSGLIAPDGHSPSRAHETDLYYADLDGSWTDAANLTGVTGSVENDNVAGDGKFDQSDLPSAVELMTGRVDFANMEPHRKNESEYLRDYIQKSHAWRQGLRPTPYRGLKNSGYLFMEHNWLRAMFGAAATTSLAFQPTLQTNAHVWAVDFGNWDGADQTMYGGVDNRAIFFMNFGSYKQMWARQGNAMRALLCQPDWGLTVAWGARPAFHMHHMAAGLPVGYSALRTENNYFRNQEYTPPGEYSFLIRQVSMNLMGDPTLRMHPALPPGAVTVHGAGGTADLTWTAPTDATRIGFHVYSASSRLGPYTRLTATPLAPSASGYTDPAWPGTETWYQVRSVVRTTVPTGTFFNQSQGVFARLASSGAGNALPQAATPAVLLAQDSVPTPVAFPGSDADGDVLVPIVVTNPQHGQLHWNKSTAAYVSAAGYIGADSFTYRLFDGVGLSDPVTASVDVAASRPDVLLAWTFGVPSGTPQDPNSTAHHAQILPSALVRGSACTTGVNSANTNAYYVGMTETAALAANAYMEWPIAPTPGATMSLRQLSFFAAASKLDTASTAPALPCDFALRVSTDGFTTWQAVPLDQGGSNLTTGLFSRNCGRFYSADLSGLPALQGCSTTATFRLYMWNTRYISLGRSGDGLGQSSADLVVFGSAGLANTPPTAAAGADRTINDTNSLPGEDVTLDGSASTDSDGTIVSWTWKEGATTIATGATPTVALSDGVHNLTLTVIDDDGASTSDTVVITVNTPTPNTPPTVNAGADRTIADSDSLPGESVTLAGTASDSDGTIASWTWKEGATTIATGATPTVALSDGVHTLTLTVVDDDGASASDTVVITVNAPTPNTPPTVNAGADRTIADSDSLPGESVTLAGTASDSDGTIASWTWKEGATIIGTGATPTVSLSDGVHTLTLTVVDDDGASASDTVVITVTAPTPNAAPTVNAGADRTIADSDSLPGESVTLAGTASDSDGTIVSWTWKEGATTIATGATPTVSLSDGVHTLSLTVIDDDGASTSDTVVITVTAPTPNAPPTVNAGADRTIADSDNLPGESVTLAGSATDSDGTVVSWTWKEGASTIATGATPTVALSDGVHTLTLTVTDDDGASASDTVVITVTAPDRNPPTTPASVTSTIGSDGTIILSWDASTDDTAISGYEVVVDSQVVGTVSAPGYTLPGFSPGTSHNISIQAVDAAGNRSTPSAPVLVTTPATNIVTVRPGGGSAGCGSGGLALTLALWACAIGSLGARRRKA